MESTKSVHQFLLSLLHCLLILEAPSQNRLFVSYRALDHLAEVFQSLGLVLQVLQVLRQNALILLFFRGVGLLGGIWASPFALFQHVCDKDVLYPSHSIEVFVDHLGHGHHEDARDVVVEFVVFRQLPEVVYLSVERNELLYAGVFLIQREQVIESEVAWRSDSLSEQVDGIFLD